MKNGDSEGTELKDHPVLKPYASQINFPTNQATLDILAGSYGNAINDQQSYESVGCALTSGFGTATLPPAQKEILEDYLGKVCNQINEAYKALVPLIEDCNNANGVVNDILNTLQTQGKNPVKVFEFGKNAEETDITALWNGLKGTQTPVSTNNPDNPAEVMLLRSDGVKMKYSPSNGNNFSYLKFTKDECESKIEDKVKKFNKKIDDTGLKPCMKTILADLKNLTNGSVAGIIAKFAGNFQGFDWKVQDGNLSGQTGQTSPIYNKQIGQAVTTFDSEAWLDATDISWARTMLHESVHAYLTVYFATNKPGFIGTYPQMVKDWGIFQNWNDVHHEEFARSLVTIIADALQEYGNNKGYSLSRQFYEDMSWGGLHTTSTFTNLPLNTQNRILDVLSVELTGKDLTGSSKTQKETKAGC